MSRKNEYRCRKCGSDMPREFVRRMVAELAARTPGADYDERILERCGDCRAMHYEEPYGMRLLTTAEVFDLEVRVPALMSASEEACEAVAGCILAARYDDAGAGRPHADQPKGSR